MIEKLDSSLTLDDKLYLAIHEYKRSTVFFLILIGFVIFATGYALLLVASADSYLSQFDFDFIPVEGGIMEGFTVLDVTFTAVIVLIIIIIFLIGFGIWLGIRGSKFFRELSDMQRQKMRQSYFLALETTVPQGETTVERIFDVLRNIVPEIKLAKINAEEKGKKLQYDFEWKIKDQVFDLKINTEEGIILVEYFNRKLEFKDIEGFVKRIDKAFHDGGLLRVVCVAKDFDDSFFIDELEDKIKKLYMPYKMDIIKEDKSGFSTIWID